MSDNEENVIAPVVEDDAPVDTNVEVSPAKQDAGSSNGGQKMKTPNKKKTPSKAKSPTKHPPWNIMIVEAIVALKDRTGSSNIAIKKWIVAQYPAADNERLRVNLNKGLKSGISSNRLARNKASYKIHPDFRKKMKAKQSSKAKAKKKPTAAELAAQKEKDRIAAKEKARQERIRKRKFPMEDLKLIAEDKELGISVKLPTKPTLPLVFAGNKKICDSDSFKSGILDDAFFIYNFLRGDVGWGLNEKNGVAPFTLGQWLECICQVHAGASKRSKMLPPLMTHLFVVTLQNLVPPALQCALTPASWLQIAMLYLDGMKNSWQEFKEENRVLQGFPIDSEYLFHVQNEESDELVGELNKVPYLHDDKMTKLYYKTQISDAWALSAEELLLLLRMLVDDLLANSPEIAADLDVRLEDTFELLKIKRSADANFRKLQTTRNKELSEIKSEEKEKTEHGKKTTRSNTKSCSVSEVQLESARRAQQKATDAYETACRSRRIRMEPVGLDRNFHQVFHFSNDPQRAYVLQRGKKISDVPYKLPGLDSYKTSWHSIDRRSTLESYLESLDVRGERESSLHHGLEPACKLVHDDIKIANEKKAQLKEKRELQRKLENAKLKCEFGRKSGRLAAQSEQEFIVLQTDIELLEDVINGKAAPTVVDLEEDTGLNMLRDFDNEGDNPRRRATRRDAQKKKEDEELERFPKLLCSKLWSSGNIDGTGLVGSIVWEVMQLEKRVEHLASIETKARKNWITNLENAALSWHISSPPVLEDVANAATSPDGSKSKKQKTNDTPVSVTSASSSMTASTQTPNQILNCLKKPLLQLEDRIFGMTGLAMATKDADDADDCMSTSPEEDREEQVQQAWKKIINRLHRLPAKAHAKIRQAVVEGIAAARKAHNPAVVAALRNALLEFHADAAGACKNLALATLEQHGGYDDMDDDDEEDLEEVEQSEQEKVVQETEGENMLQSMLCADAIVLSGCLDGKEDVSRGDWIEAVKNAKTFSKIAALAAGFVTKASDKLAKIESEHDTLCEVIEAWEKAAALRNKKKSSEQDIPEVSEVWANVSFTNEFVLAKAGPYPYWPAKKCLPKDKDLSDSLRKLGRTLVSLVGESGGLRVVKTEDILPFSEKLPESEDLSVYSKDMRGQLEDCMTMARRILRGKEKKSPRNSHSDNGFKEEKKLAT